MFVIVYHRLDLGLALTLFWAPFFLFPVELYAYAFPMSEMLMLITAAAWLLHLLVDWGRARQSRISNFPLPSVWSHFNNLDWAVIALLLLGAISLAWTMYRAPAITELRTVILEPALFYAVLRSRPSDQRTPLLLVDALLVAGVAVSLIGLLLFLRGEAVITAEEGVRRLASVYGSPNNLSLFLGRCIPFVLAFALCRVDRLRRLAAVAALLIMGLALLLTQSAGALFLGLPLSVGGGTAADWWPPCTASAIWPRRSDRSRLRPGPAFGAFPAPA